MRSGSVARMALRTLSIALVLSASVFAGCGSADLKGAPDVSGLSLPDAKAQLKAAGFGASVTSDAMLGVIIEENFTVCKVKEPKGKLVPLEVSKSC